MFKATAIIAWPATCFLLGIVTFFAYNLFNRCKVVPRTVGCGPWTASLHEMTMLTNFSHMNDKNDQVPFHASSTGRLYIKEEEFFRSSKVKKMIDKLLGSSLYKEIKENQAKVSANR
jgi:hypothetical protein